MDIRFSSSAENPQLTQEVETLLKNEWELNEEHTGLRREFYFKTYTKCLVSAFLDRKLLTNINRTFSIWLGLGASRRIIIQR